MIPRRFLSRERPAQRVTAPDEMPPRPPEGRRPPADDIWGVGAATVVNPDPQFDPCGAPAIGAGRRGRKRWP